MIVEIKLIRSLPFLDFIYLTQLRIQFSRATTDLKPVRKLRAALRNIEIQSSVRRYGSRVATANQLRLIWRSKRGGIQGAMTRHGIVELLTGRKGRGVFHSYWRPRINSPVCPCAEMRPFSLFYRCNEIGFHRSCRRVFHVRFERSS
jgi:hypothetical protein